LEKKRVEGKGDIVIDCECFDEVSLE